MNNCSNCGHSPLDFKYPEDDKHKRYVCSNCEMIHYQNPKIICGALVFYKKRSCFVKEVLNHVKVNGICLLGSWKIMRH